MSVDFFKYRSLVVLVGFVVLFLACNKEEPKEEEEVDHAYITEVFDYVYAPGQHSAVVKPTDIKYFIGNPEKNDGWLYLGGFGGYVIAGFDHNVINENGYDFEVFALPGPSPEPAVVYVMCDENGDGLPNDGQWYELKGSQYGNSKRNYWVCYYKPDNATQNIEWVDSDENKGELIASGKSSYSWWWNFTTGNQIKFEGTRLPDAYVNSSNDPKVQNWLVPEDMFEWGYAENNQGQDFDKTSFSNKFDISNAIDKDGNPVSLPHIRFVKVQTAVLQQAGWLNEVSSELRGAKDLNY